MTRARAIRVLLFTVPLRLLRRLTRAIVRLEKGRGRE